MSNFDNQDVYKKHQPDCDCPDKSKCTCPDPCGCCPPGLVSVQDCDHKDIGCLTPQDAAEYEVQKHIPPTGFIKTFHPITFDYVGDMTVEDSLAFLAAVDPNVTGPVAPGLFNISTTDDVDLSAPAPAATDSIPLDFVVDRITCLEEVAIAFQGAVPAGITFLGGATTLTILEGQSITSDGILIDDQVGAGTIVLTIAYTSCGGTKTKTLTLNVT